MAKEFKGEIKLDIRDSTPDWAAFLADRAPEGAPNVLVVLYDDTGCAAWSPYGGRINMPTMQRLADNGLTYSQWHTTALCSPTRSTFLTGRNHHQNGFASISETSTGFPGYNSHIPPENATMATVLRDAGWWTFWVGKNHNIPVDAWTMGASKKDWPLARATTASTGSSAVRPTSGIPTWPRTTTTSTSPTCPRTATTSPRTWPTRRSVHPRLQAVGAGQALVPVVLPGANHAPHHAPQEYIDKYQGKFDDGYEAYREWVLPRMIERGILPDGTELTPINPMPPGTLAKATRPGPGTALSDEEKRLFSRMAEVYAGFSEYTDAQVGRIVDYLEESGQLDNTLILYAADNGASGEGSPNGSVNENKFFNAWPDTTEDNLAMIDQLGTPATYNHYPTGWAVAFSTPYRMFKRYSYQGGVAAIRWWSTGRPASRPGARSASSTTTAPTSSRPSSTAAGSSSPRSSTATGRPRCPGSRCATASTRADAPTTKETQYYEMLGTRGIWHRGWKAVTEHGPGSAWAGSTRTAGSCSIPTRTGPRPMTWPTEHPDKLEELKALWLEEAREQRAAAQDMKVIGNPEDLDDLHRHGVHTWPCPPSGQYTYYPGTTEVPERSAANDHGVSYKVLAEVEFTATPRA